MPQRKSVVPIFIMFPYWPSEKHLNMKYISKDKKKMLFVHFACTTWHVVPPGTPEHGTPEHPGTSRNTQKPGTPPRKSGTPIISENPKKPKSQKADRAQICYRAR